MEFAYYSEKNNKLESNDSEKVYEEDAYDILCKIEKSNKELVNNHSAYNDAEYELVLHYINQIKQCKSNIKNRLLSLMVSVSILSGVVLTHGVVTALVASKNKLMPCATLSYNEVTGYSKDIEDVKASDGKNETFIKIYEPWNMQSERKVKVYDVSSLDDMELEEYLKLNLEEMGIDYTTLVETLNDNVHVILNNDEVREVIKKVVYPEDTKINLAIYRDSFGLLLALINIYLIVSLICANQRRKKSILLYKLIDDYSDIKNDKESIESISNDINSYHFAKLLEYSVSMTNIIKRNVEFRNKFVSEINRLKYSDPSEIIEEFKRVCSEVDISSYSVKYDEMLKTLKYYGEEN